MSMIKFPFGFLSSSEEWHAFVIGWAETACPWHPLYRYTKAAEYTPEHEYHYYLFGRVVGFFNLLLTLSVLASFIWLLWRVS